MDDDFWEMMFILFADWRVVLVAAIVLAVLSVTGVIPWSDWI
jgi:hypothetical protein